MAPSKLITPETNNDETKRRLPFPYEIKDVDETINRKLLMDFSGERTGYVQVGPKKYFFPCKYRQEAECFYNFEVRSDDIWIVTFPRSGTTWTQEIVWLISNDLDYETAANVSLGERCPFLEFSSFFHSDVKGEILKENDFSETRKQMIEMVSAPNWQTLSDRSEQRIIKTHLPFSLLPPNLLTAGCKVIYVARNPKDVIISFYHLNKLFRTQGYNGNLSKYWDYFRKNLQPWTPYWAHVQEGWDQRHRENVLFMFYEDMIKESLKSIEKIATFLGKTYTKVELLELMEHLRFDNFRKNPSVNNDDLKELGIIHSSENGFIRKGKIGSWKDELDNSINEEIDEWISNEMKHTNIVFPV